MKTIRQALKDEIRYPLEDGFIENVIIRRSLDCETEATTEVMNSDAYRGAFADCLYSLIQAINFSEADKSVGSLSEKQITAILSQANSIYQSIGEPAKELEGKPTVYIGG